jgi:choline transporter-like protein 2/4/5
MGEENPKDDTADHPDNKKLEHAGWNDIKEMKRGCTDCPCILLLIAAWVAMTIIGLIAIGAVEDPHLRSGNPARLTHAMDYEGNICGFSEGLKSKKYGYYLPDQTAVCVSKCPSQTSFEKFVCQYDLQASVDSDSTNGLGNIYVMTRSCMYHIETKPYINRCVPTADTFQAAADFADTAFSGQNVTSPSYQTASEKSASWFSDFLGDLYSLRGYIFGFGIAVTVGIAFTYLYILRIPGFLFFFIWGIIGGVFVCMLVGSWLLWGLANDWSGDGQHNKHEVLTMRVIAYIGMAITFCYLCLIIVLRKRVNLAIGIVKQAARALTSMPTLLLMPVIQSFAMAFFLAPWVIYTLFLASSGEIKTYSVSYSFKGVDNNSTYRQLEYTQNTRYAFLYMLFSWYWTSEFIIAIGQLVIALSFVAWYFTRDKTTIGTKNVYWAFSTTFWHHLGTAAFGSLIIAVIKTIRAVLTYFQKKAKKNKNKVMQYILCMVQCCMVCLEKIMKFVSKNAYIITAIYGTSFCSSARKAFFLLLRNVLRVAAVSMVSTFLLGLGQLFIPLATTFLCYLAMAYNTGVTKEVSGIVAPLVFTFILSYWISSMFLEIYGMGIETMLMCFIADEEMFKPEDRFAEAELMSTIQKTAQDAAKARVVPEESLVKSDGKDETVIAIAEPVKDQGEVF